MRQIGRGLRDAERVWQQHLRHNTALNHEFLSRDEIKGIEGGMTHILPPEHCRGEGAGEEKIERQPQFKRRRNTQGAHRSCGASLTPQRLHAPTLLLRTGFQTRLTSNTIFNLLQSLHPSQETVLFSTPWRKWVARAGSTWVRSSARLASFLLLPGSYHFYSPLAPSLTSLSVEKPSPKLLQPASLPHPCLQLHSRAPLAVNSGEDQ